MVSKAIKVIALCLRDNVLREFVIKKTTVTMSAKHELLYMTKNLAHKLSLK